MERIKLVLKNRLVWTGIIAAVSTAAGTQLPPGVGETLAQVIASLFGG